MERTARKTSVVTARNNLPAVCVLLNGLGGEGRAGNGGLREMCAGRSHHRPVLFFAIVSPAARIWVQTNCNGFVSNHGLETCAGRHERCIRWSHTEILSPSFHAPSCPTQRSL